MNNAQHTPTPATSAAHALSHIRNGGRAYVATALRIMVIDRHCLNRFEKAGHWLLKDDGNGIRMRSGKGSVYLFPGQLMLEGT